MAPASSTAPSTWISDACVALKVLPALLTDDEQARARFRREGAVQARFEHPSIVPLYEVGEAEDGLWIAMKLIDGPDLADALDEGRTTADIFDVLQQIASALDAAHAAGIVHRDVKPHNILISDADGRAFLADFGLTRSAVATAMTRTGQLSGTLTYLAPEQIMGEPATSASDRYAFAAVVFEALTGRPPFIRDNEGALLFAHVSEAPPRASEIRPSLPTAVDDILARGLAKQPDARPATATALIAEVRSALGETAASAISRRERPTDDVTRHGVAVDRPPASPRSRRRIAPVLIGVALAVAAIGGFVSARPSTATEERAAPFERGDLRIAAGERWVPSAKPVPVPGLALEDAITFRLRDGRGDLALHRPFEGRRADAAPGHVPQATRAAARADRSRQSRPVRGAALPRPATSWPRRRAHDVRAPHRGRCRGGQLRRSPRRPRVRSTVRGRAEARWPSPAPVARASSPQARTHGDSTRVVQKLARDRRSLRRRFATAATRRGQARAALDLRRSFRRAGTALEDLETGPADRPATRALARALKETGTAYGQLGRALTARSDRPYREARATVNDAEQAARRALRSFEELAYEVTR